MGHILFFILLLVVTVVVSFYAKKRGRSFWLWLLVQIIIVFIVPPLAIGVSGGDGIATKVVVIAAWLSPIFIFFAHRYFSKASRIVAIETSINGRATRHEEDDYPFNENLIEGSKKSTSEKESETPSSPNVWQPFLNSIETSESDLPHYREYLTSKFFSYIKTNRPKCSISHSDITEIILLRIPYAKFNVDISFEFGYQSGEFNEIGYNKAMERYEVPYQIWQQSKNDWIARYGKHGKFSDPLPPSPPTEPSKNDYIIWGEWRVREERAIFSENLWDLSESGVPEYFVDVSSKVRVDFDLRSRSEGLFPSNRKLDYLISDAKKARMKSKVNEFAKHYYARGISNPVIKREDIKSEVFDWIVIKCSYKSGDATKSIYLDPMVDFVHGDLPLDIDAAKRWFFVIISWCFIFTLLVIFGKFETGSVVPGFLSLIMALVWGGLFYNLSRSKNIAFRKMAEKLGFWENKSLPKPEDRSRFTSY